MTPPTHQWGPLRTPHQPKAKRSPAVKSSPTGPREARREAVPLDGQAKRSYPNHPAPRTPTNWLGNCGRSIKGSDTPHPRKRGPLVDQLLPAAVLAGGAAAGRVGAAAGRSGGG